MPLSKVRAQAGKHNLTSLALSFALPHENKPMRLPVVPAVHTSLLDVMSDGSLPVPDGASRRFTLCRDPCYPLWGETLVASGFFAISATGSATSWNLPARANSTIAIPNFDYTYIGGGPTFDGITIGNAAASDRGIIVADAPASVAVYIPAGAYFHCVFVTAAAAAGTGVEVEVVSQVGGEEFVNTIVCTASGNTYVFSGISGGTTATSGALAEGFVPIGFSWIRQVRTTATAPTASLVPNLLFGWGTNPLFAANGGTATVLLPVYTPPEFGNSIIPYTRTRANATAALFTNVTAALSKEGTILAARLKPAVVDMWNFGISHVNSVHPSFRYFGPMEKGLYSFTSPSQNSIYFEDAVMTIPSQFSNVSITTRPKFSFKDYGVYNAMIFSDLGSAATGTQLAVSLYAHLEFEATSALFTPGVSTLPMESLHAAEIALLDLGHFHENPIHWALLKSLASQAASRVLPLVAPYALGAAKSVARAGVAYVQKRISGDRTMPQASMQPARKSQNVRKSKKVKAQKKRK